MYIVLLKPLAPNPMNDWKQLNHRAKLQLYTPTMDVLNDEEKWRLSLLQFTADTGDNHQPHPSGHWTVGICVAGKNTREVVNLLKFWDHETRPP